MSCRWDGRRGFAASMSPGSAPRCQELPHCVFCHPQSFSSRKKVKVVNLDTSDNFYYNEKVGGLPWGMGPSHAASSGSPPDVAGGVDARAPRAAWLTKPELLHLDRRRALRMLVFAY